MCKIQSSKGLFSTFAVLSTQAVQYCILLYFGRVEGARQQRMKLNTGPADVLSTRWVGATLRLPGEGRATLDNTTLPLDANAEPGGLEHRPSFVKLTSC